MESEDYTYYDQYLRGDFVGNTDETVHIHHGTSANASSDATTAPDASADDYPGQRRPGCYEEDESFSDNINEDEEEDLGVEGNIPVNHPRLLPIPPRCDSFGNKFVTIVDISGIHHLPVVRCLCPDRKEDDIMFLELGLFPASYKVIATVFTLACLKDFRISNLECKTTAYQYFQKLRRLTSPAFPKAVSNRYQELRRVSRQYRNLTLRKWHGYAHGAVQSKNGSLALFCAACPQPGVNLKDNWKEDENRSLYIRSIVTDGNFKSDHVRQRNPADDVYLTNGEAFMTAQGPYREHLEEAVKNNKRYEQKPTCHKYHVTQDQNINHHGCDITGHAMCACARHGCFAPGSGVDFQKGERQMNIDWSLFQALLNINLEGIVDLLMIYDVMCQYHIYLLERFASSSKLTIPQALRVIKAIGLFHVHGHKEECLYQFATSFIPGVGIIDGEILETLWVPMNKISPSMRTASIPHRIEVFDDHMGDSNWKKTINIASTISKKYLRAVKEEDHCRHYFEDLNKGAPQDYIPVWTAEIEEAEAQRHVNEAVMDVMKSRINKGELQELASMMSDLTAVHASVLSKKEIELQLTTVELENRDEFGQTGWITTGLEIEEEQVVLRRYVRQLGPKPPLAERLELARKRQRLRAKLDSFTRTSTSHLGIDAVELITELNEGWADHPAVSDDEDKDETYRPVRSTSNPESEILALPSALPKAQRRLCGGIKGLLLKEQQLREGQAGDALQQIRESLGHLAWQFKNKVRVASTNKMTTRAWGGVHVLNRVWRDHRKIYLQCRQALFKIRGQDHPDFPFLAVDDCRVSTVVVEPNARGISSQKLSWLWSSTRGQDAAIATNSGSEDIYMLEFYRLHWLRARARFHRWSEELLLTKHEMEWSTRFFVHMAEKWAVRRDGASIAVPGLRSYAERQVGMWNELGRVVEATYNQVCDDRPQVWKAVA